MVNKRGLVFSLILLSMFLLTINFSSAADCQVVSGNCPSGYTQVMRLSSQTNAHGGTTSSAYPYQLCCSNGGSTGGSATQCTSSNTILKLSSTTNAHAQLPSQSGYSINVCYGALSYYSKSGSCNTGDAQILSLSSATNAHIGSFSAYNTKICGATVAPIIECGNSIIESGETCDDGDTSSGDGCSSQCQIESGWTCTPTAQGTGPSVCTEVQTGTSCVLSSANWVISSVSEGSSVLLFVYGNEGCSGEQVIFRVRESDLIGYNNVALNPSPVTFGAGQTVASGMWNAEWQAEGFPESDPPEYYFDAWLASDPSEIVRSSNPKLEVQKATVPTYCGDGSIQSPNDNGQNEQCDDGNTVNNDGCSSTCQNECTLDSASWSKTSSVDGEVVSLNVNGPNCGGKTIIFQVKEDDGFGNSDDNVQVGPPSAIFNLNSATTTWNSEWPGFTDGETTPEYYFTATIPTLGISITSPKNSAGELHVTENVQCGNNVINTGETCDDGNTVSGDGCSYPECQLEATGPVCGNSVIETGETCDQGNGNTVSGDGCSSTCQEESGWDCVGEPSTCTRLCGNGQIDSGEQCDGTNLNGNDCSDILSGYTGTPGCNSNCQYDTSSCVAPPECTISSASWSETLVEEGTQVFLNVQTANCNNGETVSFVIKERDGTLNADDDINNPPSNAQIQNNAVTGSWTAEFQDDSGLNGNGNPPEYYFTVTVVSNGESLQSSSTADLNVLEQGDLACYGKTSCDSYTDQTSCEADACTLGPNSVGSNVACGNSYDDNTRCLETTDCGCTWDGSSCIPVFDSNLNCNSCGNGVLDFLEECDDGNVQNGDGCSSICEFENGINGLCPKGLTLCSDNTCSLNCEYTDDGNPFCNYNGIPEEGEGCTCEDWNGGTDTCGGSLTCSFVDGACCNSEADGICTPSCAFIDPDCGGANAVCGNSLRETGEQCDDGNLDSNDGCSATCTYEVLSPPCVEGTTLCGDNTCSLNCDYTDAGYGDCSDGGCCATGLDYSSLDNACCNNAGDLSCNPYCASVDPDCGGEIFTSGKNAIGQCVYTKNSNDNCDDGFLNRDYAAIWVWNAENTYDTNPDSTNPNYILGADSKYHYDPIDFSGNRKSSTCENINDKIICPAQVELSFFDTLNLIIAVVVLVLVYLYLTHRKRKSKKRNKKGKK